VAASLAMSHWEGLQVDTRLEPKSEEVREKHREDAALLYNLARRLLNVVRVCKGCCSWGRSH
jgi:hypothetical protein